MTYSSEALQPPDFGFNAASQTKEALKITLHNTRHWLRNRKCLKTPSRWRHEQQACWLRYRQWFTSQLLPTIAPALVQNHGRKHANDFCQ